MSDAAFSLDQRKTLAEIDQLYANTHKLLLEATKLGAEAAKMNFEATKFSAEAVKLQNDARFAPWQVAFAGFSAGALIIGAVITAMKVLGV